MYKYSWYFGQNPNFVYINLKVERFRKVWFSIKRRNSKWLWWPSGKWQVNDRIPLVLIIATYTFKFNIQFVDAFQLRLLSFMSFSPFHLVCESSCCLINFIPITKNNYHKVLRKARVSERCSSIKFSTFTVS